MSITIVKESRLTDLNTEDLQKHYQICNGYDHTRYVFDEDEDFCKEDDIHTFLLYDDEILVSSLHIFAPTRQEAEITALTAPGCRQRGYFRILLQCALKELTRRGLGSLLFVCDSCSKDGKAVLSHLKIQYEFSEFLMEYRPEGVSEIRKIEDVNIAPASAADKPVLAEISREAFDSEADEALELINEFFCSTKRELYSIRYRGRVVGMIGVYKEPGRSYIYGFCIDREFRKQGIGTYVLKEVVNMNIHGGRSIVLEVQVDNINALRAYEQVGFAIEAEFQYYRIAAEKLLLEDGI